MTVASPRPADMFRRQDDRPTGWAVSSGLVDYEIAVRAMEARARAIRENDAGELVWLLEHPPLYTAGTSADPSDLKDPNRFPVFQAARGGRYTYHGPGQRVAYVMLDLRARRPDVRAFVGALEAWLIDALQRLGVTARTHADRVGVWVPGGEAREDKIAAIGVRLKRWVSYHGVSLNVAPDLTHFDGITPCGVADPRYGVGSMACLRPNTSMEDVDAALREAFAARFGPVQPTAAPA